MFGVDMSPGMLLAARSRAPTVGLLAADAMALPVRRVFESQLRVPDAEPIAAYVRSRVPDAGPLAEAVLGRLPADPARFPITTHSGCLVCS